MRRSLVTSDASLHVFALLTLSFCEFSSVKYRVFAVNSEIKPSGNIVIVKIAVSINKMEFYEISNNQITILLNVWKTKI